MAGGQPERDAQQEDVVGVAVLRSMFRWRGDLVDDGEDLEGDVAVDEAGHVHVTTVATFQEVAAPQERVGVEIGDGQRLVQRPGTLRCRVRRHERRRVVASFRARHQPSPGRPTAGDGRQADGGPDGHRRRGRA